MRARLPLKFRPGSYGDPNRLRQVLTNLVANAIKFTETGEVVVRVQLLNEEADSVVPRFEVTDTGIGVAPEHKAKIFQAFCQAGGSTARRYGGSGLGLSVSQQLSKLMGGDIGVTGAPGKGSSFWFTARFEKSSSVAPAKALPPHNLAALRVLVVDDNATNHDILQGQLNLWGVSCDIAEDGVRALGLLRTSSQRGIPYHLAILDLMMPEMDGLEVAKAIHSDPSPSDLSLLMLTSAELSPSRAGEVGIAACLSKPVRQSQLYDCIASVMGPVFGHQAARPANEENGLGKVDDYQALVLLVEDNPVNQQVGRAMLQILGFQVEVAADGRETFEAFQNRHFELIFMDCQMLTKDGYEATRAIGDFETSSGTAKGGTPRVPIVALTAHAMAGERAHCLAVGMDDHLSKPFTIEQLRLLLDKWLKSKVKAQVA